MSGRGRKKNTTTKQDETVVPTKRGGTKKKQFPVVAVVTQDGIEGTLQPESRRPLIAHLPIQSRDVIFHDAPIKYDPAPPSTVEPFNSVFDNPFADQAEVVVNPPMEIEKVEKAPAVGGLKKEQEKVDYYKKGLILAQYKNSSDLQQIPDQVDAACMWCCHSFDWRPCILPIRDEGRYLVVTGNFCSPQCTMAYLFDARQDSHTRWEQVALLHRIYCEDPIRDKIYPAPPRNSLKMFGGLYTIEEYRGLVRQEKIRVDVHLPPMVSILATLDTKPIDFYDTSLTKNIMDAMQERLKKAEEVLKLRRTKPLKAWENTLDACMNLKVTAV